MVIRIFQRPCAPSRVRNGLLIVFSIISFILISFVSCYAETVNYVYDDLNRLIRVEYEDGTVVQYTYDKTGNRLVQFIDAEAPITTASPPGGIYPQGLTVTLACDDGAGFGCDKIYYTTDGTDPTTSSNIYSTPIPVSDTMLKFFARDLAGHSEGIKSHIYTVDAVPPSGTIIINSGAVYTNSTNVTLILSCTDPNGCSQMQFSNDNITYSTAESYGTNKLWSLESGDGAKTVYVKFKDVPGNWSGPFSDTILLDTTPPATAASPAGGTYTSAQSVALTCSDGTGSGCDKIHYTIDGTTPTTASQVFSSPINISVDSTLRFFATDLIGNSEAVKGETYDIYSGPVKIGSASYSTIQLAYNAAISGNIIRCQDLTFTENVVINRDIAVTLEGGYDSNFTTNAGGMTTIKGMLTTTSGGGTLTIKNFILGQ